MPLRSLRPNRSERDLKRRSTLDPGGFFKRSERDRSTDTPNGGRIAASEDCGRPPSSELGRPSTSQNESPLPSPPIQEATPNTRRFSMMRFRHASDPQLSAKAKEQAAAAAAAARENAPPVPSVPTTQPPAIITTAPTMVEQDMDAENAVRKRGRLQQFTLRRRSFDPTAHAHELPGSLRKSMEKKRRPLGFKKNNPAHLAQDEERHSLSQLRLDEQARENAEGVPALTPPAPRASESSRSDGSSGGHVSFEHTPRPHHPPRTGSGRFTFGRKKQRAPLFPLPMKIEPPQFPDTAPATPRVSTGGISTSSQHSPLESPPLTARRVNHGDPGAQTPPMPSASQVALAATSLNLASPAAGTLFRTDSTKSISRSVRSARSSPNGGNPARLGMRGRSSTMGSLGGRSDAGSPTPPNLPSGRNSTSTAGRSSFSNLFGLGARFRQNSEPHSPRYGSPAHGLLGASGFLSHNNSLNISRETLVLPEREEGETPGHYLERIEANNVDRSIIASYLSKSDDPFLLAVLRSYMRRFAFFGDPIDMAIRKLLMQVELPKETQQIDRVLQGFADRYHECNPGIYINTDNAYFISFSIIILHTDFFNKNNKRKMQRPDYIKNSSCEGVSDDVLSCFYDNVVYTPFIHIEDDVDLKTISSKKSRRTAVLKGPNDPARKAHKEPIDPYTLIFEGKLDALRPNIRDVMNLDDPYNYIGTAPTLDTRNIYKLFSRYGVIQIVSSRSRPEAFMSEAAQENPLGTSVGIVEMPVTKVGVLWRKDTKRKKARSPWQEWGAVLTRSGLSLFRNSSWTKNLISQHEAHQKHGETGPVLFQPPLQDFKQDHLIPMDGAVALVDNTYKKHKNAFVMFTKSGEETFLADSEKDLNEWLGVLNYTAAFETLGVRSRGMIGGLYEGQRNRGLRRLESSHSGRSVQTPTGEVTITSGRIDTQFAQQMMAARKELMQVRISESEDKLVQAIKELEVLLRDARHLQILAPIQPKSREQIIHAAGRLSAKLKWSRIEIWRMKCHRDILAQELEDEKQGSAERQARIDQISQSSLSPQLSQRATRIGSLARLASKSSSLTSGHQKPPLSPGATSGRPGTKSSRDTDFGVEEAFRTPPESTAQPSPSEPTGQFQLPPMNFSPPTSDRRSSIGSLSLRSRRLSAAFEKRPSISTAGGNTADSDSDSDDDHRRYSTPPPIGRESLEPRTPEVSTTDGARSDVGMDSETEQHLANHTGSPASRGKHRRSLHRTLRDAHGGSGHRRSFKGRDSGSTILSEDMHDSEGLARSKGSFTVHGKKASVIQFGSDWQNLTAEERLKTKRQHQEAQGAASADERDGNSIVSSSTAHPISLDGNEEIFPPRLNSDTVRSRHVSSQTITPASYRESVKEQHDADSDDSSDMSDIAEESPTTKRPISSASKHENEASTDDVDVSPKAGPSTVEA